MQYIQTRQLLTLLLSAREVLKHMHIPSKGDGVRDVGVGFRQVVLGLLHFYSHYCFSHI